MRCYTHDDLAEFAGRVLPWLTREPVINNVPSTLIDSRVARHTLPEPDALFLSVIDDADALTGVALQTPPMPLLLSAMSADAARALGHAVAQIRPGIPGASGLVGSVEVFVHAFTHATGAKAELIISQCLFRLDRVEHPSGVQGNPRTATRADRDQLVAWSNAFAAEATSHQPPRDNAQPVDARLAGPGLMWLWEVDEDLPGARLQAGVRRRAVGLRRWSYSRRLARLGTSCRIRRTRSRSRSATVTPTASGSCATTVPQGSITMLRPKQDRPGSWSPICPAATT